MEIINRKISELTPYARNPRKNDGAVEYVANSIREFGFKVPIVISSDGEIIAGHTRLKAAKKLGMKEVPCIVADDLTDEQVKAFRLADNKVGEAAEWDFDLLNEELNEIVEIDMEQFAFDFSDDEIGLDEIEKDDEKTGRVIVTIDIPNVPAWNTIEDEIKRIIAESGGTIAMRME